MRKKCDAQEKDRKLTAQLVDLARIASAADDLNRRLLATARVVDGLTNRRKLLLREVLLAIGLLPLVAAFAAQLVGKSDVLEPAEFKVSGVCIKIG